jgi:uncharacterized membrane protein YcaP (DUF421 family)
MWFDSWHQVGRAAVATSVAYVLLVALLRVSGKRTLAKFNAFDLVVTIALGSTLATIALSTDIAVAEGFVALAALILLQYVVAWFTARASIVRRGVKSEPVVVLVDGRLLADEIRSQRLSPDEVLQAIRSSGIGGTELVAAAVLETDGTLSVIPHEQRGSGNALPGHHDPLRP